MFILRFSDHNCWIAPWDGDPGRTLVRGNAKAFPIEEDAQKFADKIIKANSHRKFKLVIEPKWFTILKYYEINGGENNEKICMLFTKWAWL